MAQVDLIHTGNGSPARGLRNLRVGRCPKTTPMNTAKNPSNVSLDIHHNP